MVVCDGVAFSRRPVAGLGEYGTVCGCQCGARSTTEGRLHRGFDYRRVVLGSSLVLRRERFRRTRYQRTGDGADVGSVPVRRGGAAAAGGRDSARNNGPIDEERIADNIRSMAELARAHGMRVFLCSVLPAARYGWRPEVTDAPDRIDRLNRMLREYALDNGCEWVDFHPGLADADRALDARYTRDGVHPTSDGFDAMEAILRPYLKRYLR